MTRQEEQVIEVFFDADQWLSSADWAEPALEALHPIPAPLNISLPFTRRCSTSSTISYASSIQLSQTGSPSSATRTEDAALNTSPRSIMSSLPFSPGLHAASLFLSCVPRARKVAQQAQNSAAKRSEMRELKLVAKLASKTHVQILDEHILKGSQERRPGFSRAL